MNDFAECEHFNPPFVEITFYNDLCEKVLLRSAEGSVQRPDLQDC